MPTGGVVRCRPPSRRRSAPRRPGLSSVPGRLVVVDHRRGAVEVSVATRIDVRAVGAVDTAPTSRCREVVGDVALSRAATTLTAAVICFVHRLVTTGKCDLERIDGAVAVGVGAPRVQDGEQVPLVETDLSDDSEIMFGLPVLDGLLGLSAEGAIDGAAERGLDGDDCRIIGTAAAIGPSPPPSSPTATTGRHRTSTSGPGPRQPWSTAITIQRRTATRCRTSRGHAAVPSRR